MKKVCPTTGEELDCAGDCAECPQEGAEEEASASLSDNVYIHCKTCGGPWWLRVDPKTGHCVLECAACKKEGGFFILLSKEPQVNLEFVGAACECCEDHRREEPN